MCVDSTLEMISDATISKWAHSHFMDHKQHQATLMKHSKDT